MADLVITGTASPYMCHHACQIWSLCVKGLMGINTGEPQTLGERWNSAPYRWAAWLTPLHAPSRNVLPRQIW